jgi:hypothetical protein
MDTSAKPGVAGRHRRVPRGWRDPTGLQAAIARLSRGLVIATPASGPTFRPYPRTARRTLGPALLVPALPRGDRVLVALLSTGWVVSLVLFWRWWLQPEHRTSWVGLVVNSAVLLYLTCLPAYFLITTNRLRRVDPAVPVPAVRVAFVVTKAPSEPWPLARTTLEAMLTQRYPGRYDVWLCDEDPTGETVRWCRDRGVRISTRRGVAAYHRPVWPRRTRCKEGNLAHFYDHWGYRYYDVVAQLDCDHVPATCYLAEMVRPFADPAVGYVAAPSVCDVEGTGSWSARGRLHREAAFHGAIQAGHSEGRTTPSARPRWRGSVASGPSSPRTSPRRSCSTPPGGRGCSPWTRRRTATVR